MRRGASAHVAADLVQETFIRLLRSQAGEKAAEIHDLRAYLYRAAESAEADMRRAEIRALRVIVRGAGPDETVADPGPQVEEGMIRDESSREISDAIAGLPPRAREVLFLHKFENLSYAEIAEKLGISRNTVMVHMVRALGLLRGRFAAGKEKTASGRDSGRKLD